MFNGDNSIYSFSVWLAVPIKDSGEQLFYLLLCSAVLIKQKEKVESVKVQCQNCLEKPIRQ